MGKTYFIPASDADEARAIAEGIAAGRCGHVEHYRTHQRAQTVAEHLNHLAEQNGRATRRQVYTVEIRATHDGWIANVGEVAAVLVLFAMIPLVGIASLIEWSV